jgi:hypothetical protein
MRFSRHVAVAVLALPTALLAPASSASAGGVEISGGSVEISGGSVQISGGSVEVSSGSVQISSASSSHGQELRSSNIVESLTDLREGIRDVTDGATGSLSIVTSSGGSSVSLALTGMAAGAVGHTYGVHVHTGPCRTDEPATAGPHFNVGGPPSPRTEIWLDVAVRDGGQGASSASVTFAIPHGAARSVVIHAQPTRPDGMAGERLACLPLYDF